MRILVTNDDGFQSPFLEILCDTLSSDHHIVMTAPGREQSGIGQAISIYNSLTYEPLQNFEYEAFRLEGTPADCVKFAVCHLFRDESFDLVVSGVNPGENAGLSALYSGTVAGAREGATWGIPSIALSVWDNSPARAEMASLWLHNLLDTSNALDFPPGVFWNVNFPPCGVTEVKGVRVCQMSQAMFKDHYQEFITPRGNSEFWLDGVKHQEQFTPGGDDEALRKGYIAITPLQIDHTSAKEISRLNEMENVFAT